MSARSGQDQIAIRENVTVNIDNIDEAHRIKAIAKSLGITAINVGLRLNPGSSVYHSEDPTFNMQSSLNARQSKFGFSIDDDSADKAIEAMEFNDGLRGFKSIGTKTYAKALRFLSMFGSTA